MIKKINSILFVSIIILFSCISVFAEYVDPANIRVQTERYTPSTTDFKSGEYVYEVSWQGINVATAEISISEKEFESDTAYFVEANAKTNKVIGLFYKLKHTSHGMFYKKNLHPIQFSFYQTENSRKKRSEIVFTSDGQIKSFLEKNGKIEDKREFFTDNLTLDPISAAFLARSLPIDIGTKASFDIYNAKNRYIISFNVIAREDIRLPGSSITRKAFRVQPSLKKLTDTEGEKRFRRADIWIAADDTRDILKIESEVFIGKISAHLKEYREPGALLDDSSPDPRNKEPELHIARSAK